MTITIAVAGETLAGERRVALVPETAKKFTGLGAHIRMEQGAGKHSQFQDNEYLDVPTAANLAQTYDAAQLILRVTPPWSTWGKIWMSATQQSERIDNPHTRLAS